MAKLNVVIASLVAIASVACVYAAQPDADKSEPPRVYRVMARIDIDKLGLDGELPPNNSHEPSLERGLNLLHADGWELIAIEGGRMRTFHGGKDASLEIHPTYVFCRIAKGG